MTLGIVAALALGILGTAFALGLQLGSGHTRSLSLGESSHWTAILAEQKGQIADLKKQLHAKSVIVGDSIPMKALRQQIALTAPGVDVLVPTKIKYRPLQRA